MLDAWDGLLKIVSNKDLQGLSELLDENVVLNYLDGSTLIGRGDYLNVPTRARKYAFLPLYRSP